MVLQKSYTLDKIILSGGVPVKIPVRTLAHVAILLATEIVLSRFFSLSTPLVKIGFAFVPVVICAILYGPKWAGLMAALGDLIGAILFPIGVYFPGFTLSSGLCGVVYGLFLYKKELTWTRLLTMLFIVRILINLCLSTYWLVILTHLSFMTLLSTRVMQAVILIPIQLVVIRVLAEKVRKHFTALA